jgi:LysM repeat protein
MRIGRRGCRSEKKETTERKEGEKSDYSCRGTLFKNEQETDAILSRGRKTTGSEKESSERMKHQKKMFLERRQKKMMIITSDSHFIL